MCYRPTKVHTEQCTESSTDGDCTHTNTFNLTSVLVAVLFFGTLCSAAVEPRPAQPNKHVMIDNGAQLL